MERTDGKAALDAREARLRTLLQNGLAGDGGEYRAFLEALASHLRQFLRRRLRNRADDVDVEIDLLAGSAEDATDASRDVAKLLARLPPR